ncbi:MAG: transcription antitermination factor NusB [bacterium]|nr:transcription antitermination factor NusB [bacterium]
MRRKAREAALKVLFEVDVGRADAAESLERTLGEERLSAGAAQFARQLVDGVLGQLDLLDGELARYSHDWSPRRMGAVDRNILRLACYEMRELPDIPAGVAINEAVELAKKFSTAEAARFVNGILGQMAKAPGEHS